MYYLGIDFSINFGAACLSRDFKTFRWFANVNGSITKKFQKVLEGADKELEFMYVDSKIPKTDTYHITERNKLNNQIEVVKNLITKAKQHINDEPVIVGIEGYSYGSAGNSLVDLAQSTGILKASIYKELTNNSVQTIFVFSPSELKNAIGQKGNCGKIEVFNGFRTDPIIEELKGSALHRFVCLNTDEVFNGKEVKSPIMDMIDSTLPVIKFKSLLAGK